MSAMEKTYIRNREGKIIARYDGPWLRDGNGRLVARFNEREGLTRDRNGKIVGNGDQRLLELGRHAITE